MFALQYVSTKMSGMEQNAQTKMMMYNAGGRVLPLHAVGAEPRGRRARSQVRLATMAVRAAGVLREENVPSA